MGERMKYTCSKCGGTDRYGGRIDSKGNFICTACLNLNISRKISIIDLKRKDIIMLGLGAILGSIATNITYFIWLIII
jgi:hypothetical protein